MSEKEDEVLIRRLAEALDGFIDAELAPRTTAEIWARAYENARRVLAAAKARLSLTASTLSTEGPDKAPR